MNRELNPQLFGTRTVVEKLGNPVDPQQPATSIMGKGAESASSRQVPYAALDIKALEQQFGTLKVALLQLEKKTDSIISKMDELGRSVHTRLERFWHSVQRLEETQTQHHHETTGKFAQVAAKVNERKVVDGKVQDLVDRHNTIIRNFENRLTSLQRLVTEQEMALHNSTAALEDARLEISRLKRL
jgi:hypothetical protein